MKRLNGAIIAAVLSSFMASTLVLLARASAPIKPGDGACTTGGGEYSCFRDRASGDVPKDPRLRKIYDALVQFRSDDALVHLVPMINQQGKRGFKTETSRLAMARLLVLAGYAYYIDENLNAGIQMFSLANKLCPDDYVAKCGLANGLRDVPDFEREGRLISELEKLPDSEKNVIVHITLARHFKRVGEYDRALAHLKEVEKLDADKRDVNSQALYARTLIVDGYGKPAVEKFKEAAARTSNLYMREIFLANAALIEQNEAAQEQHLRRAGKLYPGDPIWRTKLAEFDFGHDREAEGFDLLQQALLGRRVSATAYMKMARHLWVNKRYDAAEECMRHYQSRVRQSVESQALLAEIYDARGAADKCEKTFESVIARDRFQPGSYENLAKHFMFKTKKPERALHVAAEFVKAMPNCWASHFLQAKALVANNDLARAAEAADTGLKRMPQSSEELNLYASHEAAHAHAIIGSNLYAQGKRDEALAEAKLFNSMKFNPELPAYLRVIVMRPGKIVFGDKPELKNVALADMLLETGRIADCEKEYREALKLSADDQEIRGYLLHALSKKGDWGAAAKENLVYSQQVVNKIPATVDEWTKGNKQHRQPVPGETESGKQ
jgi:tetratricopeptide (TPR) repeat protein